MPIYEFECHNHGVFEEFFASPSGAESVKCPECGKRSRRIVSRLGGTKLSPRRGMTAREEAIHRSELGKAEAFQDPGIDDYGIV